jgi:PII-like signaling protein
MKNLKIYLDNTDKYNNLPLWKYLLESSTKANLEGATVYKAVAGVGKHKEIHTFDILTLSNELPIIIEIIDTKESIDRFLELTKDALKSTFVTISDIEVLDFK